MQPKKMLKKKGLPSTRVRQHAARMIVLMLMAIASSAQPLPTNTDPTKSPVNINLPRTPESAAFEKYGNYDVNELTGMPNISVPIYSVKGRTLEAPITLTYDASGIKVNQEASWVGLGFNLSVGGRITVETKGCIDNDVRGSRLFPVQSLKMGMQGLFNRFGNSNSSSVLAFAQTYYNSTPNGVNDDWASVNAMAQYGLGEPDIFHANFMGHSFDFYFDAITDSLRFIGEKNLYVIGPGRDVNGQITQFEVIDNEGVKYFFGQTETTTMAMPALSNLFGNTSTTAWLLTKVVHPDGDSITFSYANFGNTYPAFSRNGYLSFNNPNPAISQSNDADIQDTVIQQPAYLTHIESVGTSVDFVLGNRDDLRGPGSRRLDEIRITDKLSNTVRKRAVFGYNYFYGTLERCDALMPDSLKDYYSKRLQLGTLSLNDPLMPPYQFFYYGSAPDKYSPSQDHWGYCNNGGATSFDPCSPKNPIPASGSEGNDLPYSTLSFITESMDCSPLFMPSMTMDSIVYPTGGSTKFIYEPHLSTKTYPNMTSTSSTNGVANIDLAYSLGTIIGGGQRTKTVRSYSLGKLAGTTDYAYRNGIYFGSIRYNTSAYKFTYCADNGGFVDLLTPNGAVCENDFLVGYGTVVKTETDGDGRQNGSILKQFNLTQPWFGTNNNGGLGFDVVAPTWPNSSTGISTSMLTLAPPYTNFAPTPARGLNGKLSIEAVYDSSGNLLKGTYYYYHLEDYAKGFYSAKAIDNRIGRADATGGCGNNGIDFSTNGAHRFTLFLSPAKSYHTLTDSVVETTYQGTNAIANSKAFTYDSHFQVQSETAGNSDGTQIVTNYKYPYDLAQTQVYQDMTNAHIISPTVQTSVSQGGSPVSLSQVDYFSPSPGLYVPQAVQAQIGSNPLEKRKVFTAYDAYGNLLEEQDDNGALTDYLYGYSSQYIVAKVTGSDRATIKGLVDQSILDAPTSDQQLRNYLNTSLRQNLPKALVTTYTYLPLIGLTSETGPRGTTTYHEYDAIGRKTRTRDNDNNIIKAFDYGFAQQVSFPFKNSDTGRNFYRSCSPGYSATSYYGVPAGRYGSFTSQYQADSLAIADLNTNGQAHADATACMPYYSFSACCGWQAFNSNFALTGSGSVDFSLVLAMGSGQPSGQVGTLTGAAFLPSAPRYVSLTSGGINYTLVFQPSGEVDIYGSPPANGVAQLSGTYQL